MIKCNHAYVMDCGGEIVRLTPEGLVAEKIVGKGTYCIKCGYKPKRKETPQLIKDFSKLIVKE